ncbi:MAG: hypothetical protein ACRC6V_10465 [Bacteroidales bacterium]
MNLDYHKNAIKNYFEKVDIPEGVVLAGGALTSMFSGQPVNDLDMYFSSPKALSEFLDWNELFIQSATDKALTCTIRTAQYSSVTIQCIYFDYFEKAEDIFESFDFSVNMAAYDFDSGEFVFHPEFFKDLAMKKLVFNPKTCFPIVSMMRTQKYIKRGYTISNKDFRKIILEINKLDLSSKGNFIKQIGGMYSNVALVELLFWPEDREFDIDEAMEIVSKAMETAPTINFSEARKFEEVDKRMYVPKEYMIKHLDPSKNSEFKTEPYVVEQGKDWKSIKLYSMTQKGKLEHMHMVGHFAEGSLAILHMMLYPQNHDPLLKQLESMIKQGQGFNNIQENPDYVPY